MSAQLEDDDSAAFAQQALLEFRQRADCCEKCGEPGTEMWDDRLFCGECYEYMTVWEPREGYEEFDPPEEVPEYEEDDDGDL